ncbi:uncharacterized protein LOC105214843 [Zeugodacus cucurbitae]|uniref:uncharacterized protein LOC105214843 n=1 Tax=Zeugodacus cucurbitae TaxID=28588 RepID=UPI0023D95413|nr:uncharacterized protein LOC105214843 [Zeugodacus cucurbitae]
MMTLQTEDIRVWAKVDFYNTECTVTDRSYVYFDTCRIKAVNRTYKYFSMCAKFPRRQAVHNISMAFALLRKANGYKPFLYNFTVDACKYMKKRNNPVINYFHSWFEKYSTINRTCPYGPVRSSHVGFPPHLRLANPHLSFISSKMKSSTNFLLVTSTIWQQKFFRCHSVNMCFTQAGISTIPKWQL